MVDHKLPLEVVERAGSKKMIWDHHNPKNRVTVFVAFSVSPTLSTISIVQYKWGEVDKEPDSDKIPWFIWQSAAAYRLTPSKETATSLLRQLWEQMEERIFKSQMEGGR